MQNIEKYISAELVTSIYFWRRYVHTFFIVKEAYLNYIKLTSDSIGNPIKFRVEIENTAELPFLDILLHRQTLISIDLLQLHFID